MGDLWTRRRWGDLWHWLVEGGYLKLWLFFAYVVSFVSLAASVGLLIQDSVVKTGPSVWTGTAGVLQCVFVLVSGLIYWTAHSEYPGK
ncbi:hypothetical protein TIFTF001_050521 [Ficus carica]|uniref:Uncharacterized protein n=1 Tax=Ficus carica TaxID=3494 RepID=A0AA87Z1V2_FICCA|nr:hypothetical protein TIFTF001_050521 [Ficus carica]